MPKIQGPLTRLLQSLMGRVTGDEVLARAALLVVFSFWLLRMLRRAFVKRDTSKPRVLPDSIFTEDNDSESKISGTKTNSEKTNTENTNRNSKSVPENEKTDIAEALANLQGCRKFTSNPDASELVRYFASLTTNPNRKAMIALARPWDHLGEAQIIADPDFDLDTCIFRTIRSPFKRALMKAKVGNLVHWSEQQVARVQKLYWQRVVHYVANYVASNVNDGPSNSRPPVSRLDNILKFMRAECDFAMEHADGSFLDHLQFCRDYSAIHYPQQSPRVLFLHSILGVATNLFPMRADKIPQLRSLLDAREWRHVSAFPTILRLAKATDLLDEFYADQMAEAPRIAGLECFRILDNEKISLNTEELWVHFNFHLIHSLDFLQVSGWRANANDFLLQEFANWYLLLEHCGQRVADVRLPEEFKILRGKEEVRKMVANGSTGAGSNGVVRPGVVRLEDGIVLDLENSCTANQMMQGLSRGALQSAQRNVPKKIAKNLMVRQIREFTKEIGATLDYKWLYS